MTLRVGTDLVLVESVSEALREHGERYLARVYTEREVEDCRTAQGIDAQRLAGRFAAKEAALKVLRPAGEGIALNAIEVRRDPVGWVALELSGAAASLAAREGIAELALSLAHEGDYATAVVVAQVI